MPNFSEGRRKDVVDSLAAALTAAPGAVLLDCEMDAAHNRCVITIAGEPDAVSRGVLEAVGKAVELIDLRRHQGEHPRMGATDVIPFVPISGITISECVELSIQVAQRIADQYKIPVYLYEQSARTPARQDLAYIRKGEFEVIREEIRTHPDRKPDFGPPEAHPTAGVTAVGARSALIAYNVYLNTPDVKIAQAVARAVRFSSGGLRYVKALGFEIKERNQTQVSMNLTNFEGTSIHQALEMVRREAERYGVSIATSEIVGLIPQKALDACADFYLRLENFRSSQILENRLEEALSSQGQPGLEEFLSKLAAPDPTPGGGSAAALAGSLAAALGEMVASISKGKKKEPSVASQLESLVGRLSRSRRALCDLVREDAEAYQAVLNALKLPKETDQEKSQRAEALEQANRRATEIPLRTAKMAAEVLLLLDELIHISTPNTWSDVATGAHLAYAALKGAQYNILINLPGLKDKEFAKGCKSEAAVLSQKADASLRRLESRLPAL